MGSLFGECSVMKEITKAEDAIQTCYQRVELLESRLQTEDMPEDKQEEIRTELNEVRKLLATNRQQLSQLHQHNRKTFTVAVAAFFVVFLVYCLYILVNGKDF